MITTQRGWGGLGPIGIVSNGARAKKSVRNVVLHPHIFFQTLYRAPGGGIAILGGAFKHYTEDDATVE
jgi:hypothetical protein